MTDIDKQIAERKTCRDLVEEKLSDREEYLSDLFDAVENNQPYDGYDDAIEASYDFPLEISTKIMIKILLSYGGPSDWLEVIVDKDPGYPYPEIDRVTYHYADWYDHAETVVSKDSSIYKYIDQIIDGIL